MSKKPRLLETDSDPGAALAPSGVSEMFRAFAQPLLYADPAGPADVETLRTAVMLAMICWNLPVYETMGSPLYARGVRTLNAISEDVPRAVALTLRKLIEDRKTTFAALPFLVQVEVTGSTLQNASIIAEVRMPAAKPKQ
jgi:hypothetical protein